MLTSLVFVMFPSLVTISSMNDNCYLVIFFMWCQRVILLYRVLVIVAAVTAESSQLRLAYLVQSIIRLSLRYHSLIFLSFIFLNNSDELFFLQCVNDGYCDIGVISQLHFLAIIISFGIVDDCITNTTYSLSCYYFTNNQ